MTGSIQEKNGMYHLVLNVRDEKGVIKKKWLSTGLPIKGNKRKAEKMLRDALEKYDDSEYRSKNMLLSDYFAEWLERIKLQVQPDSYRGYESNMRKHIIPYFAKKGILLQDLKPYQLEDYYMSKLRETPPLSPTTIKHHHQNISKALNDAVKRELLQFNPAANADTPKCKQFKGNFLNPDQIKQLFILVKGTPIELPVILCSVYGLRRSEVLGLTWNCVDLKHRQMTIQQTILQHTGGDYVHDTKNESSYRTLPLSEATIQILTKHKQLQDERRKIMGDCYNESDFVCTWPDGKLISNNYLTQAFHKIVLRSNLPNVRLHDLRHSVASNLLANGFSVVEVQEWLGHSSPSTTLNYYAHIDASSKKHVVKALDSMMELDKR